MFDIPILAQRRTVVAGGRKLSVQSRADRTTPNPHERHDMALARRIGEVLFLHYPGYLWKVEVDSRQGCAFIKLPILLGENFPFVLHLDKLDPALKCVVRAGGEILERFNIPRGRLDLAAFLTAKEIAPQRRHNTPPPGGVVRKLVI